jgi:diguanylate cyclase (GGDEF)-like protein/PAS domain S-box-containing protein
MQNITSKPLSHSVDFTRDPSPRRLRRTTLEVTVPDTATDAKAAIVQTMLSNTSQFRGLLDLGGCFTEVNQVALDFIGLERSDVLGLPIWQGAWWLSKATWLEVQRQTEQAALGNFRQAEYEIESQGQRVWIEFLLKPIRDPSGNIVMILAEGNNISERKRLEQTLAESERKHRLVIEAMSEGVVQFEADGTVSMCNSAAERILGQPIERIINRVPDERWRVIGEDGQSINMNDPNTPTAFTFRTGKPLTNWVMGIYKPAGELVWVLVNTQPLTRADDTLPYAVIITLTDITERKALEDQLRQAALYDALTGLPTRTLFMERLNHALHRAKREGQNYFALLFLDLDNFKAVNDSLGHDVGDQLLQDVATCLRTNLRSTDTAARLGGDEFVVLLEDVEPPTSAKVFAKRLLKQLEFRYTATQTLVVRGSLGIALGDASCTAKELLNRADEAMYQAKALGKGQFALWSAQVDV